ncbi:hypothetical protein E5676_scaffold1154G00030 [Cucumis melo var. makuwa]|uniref:Uncharacterized protein n=1 Tax=Cucumis melo var. makuwa TaxID=1194695 RepID=A0A5A7USS0_CUCMM|nr:hypothetical protein E6C27_scaffold288G00600 [Cucumis melo var. makuwa]TYK02707.1 hypothetical protein E5676_scaffold1154G00030 [Cucumis melo var. makuwa]
MSTMTYAKEKWISEKNVQLHDTFKGKAATNYDEYNPEAEQYKFVENEALPPKICKSNKKNNIYDDLTSPFNTFKVKRSISFKEDKGKHPAYARKDTGSGKGKALMHHNDEKKVYEREYAP